MSLLGYKKQYLTTRPGSGCGSVGRASFPKAEVCSSNPVIGEILFIINCIEKKKIKKKEAGNGPLKKSRLNYLLKFGKWPQ